MLSPTVIYEAAPPASPPFTPVHPPPTLRFVRLARALMSRRTNSRRAPLQSSTAAAVPHFSDSGFSGITDHHTRNALSHVIAQEVTLSLVDGSLFCGIFSGTEVIDRTVNIVLSYAELKAGGRASLNRFSFERRGNVAAKLRVPVPYMLKLHAPFSVDQILSAPPGNASAAAPRVRSRPESRGFATDAQISQRPNHAHGRQLKRFDDFSSFDPSTAPTNSSRGNRDAETFGNLASVPRKAAKWDQFQVNEEQFGVRTSFDEDEYTTKIDRTSADYARRQREAERIAAEIESKPTSNTHLQEERNQAVTSNIDEESRYSGVHRPKSYHTAQHKVKVTPHNGITSSFPAKQDVRGKAASISKASPIQKSSPPLKTTPAQKGPIPHRSTSQKNAPTVKAAALTQKVVAQQKPSPSPKGVPPQKSGVPAKSVWGSKISAASKGMTSAKVTTPQNSVPSKSVTLNRETAAPSATPALTSKHTSTAKPAMPKLSYAAAAGAKAPQKKVQTTHPVSAVTETSAQMQLPRSPVSPPKSAISAKNLTPNSLDCIQTRPRESGRMSNGGRTPPTHGLSSPSNSRNSPIASSNAEISTVDALSLESHPPQIRKSFEVFKAKQTFKNLTENRQTYTNDLKKFRDDLDAKRSSPRRSNNTQTSPVGSKSEAKIKIDKQNMGKDERVASGQASEGGNNKKETCAIPAPEKADKKQSNKEAVAPIVHEKNDKVVSSVEKKKPKKLNPNAQSFVMPSAGKPSISVSNAPQSTATGATPIASSAQPTGPSAMPTPMMDPYMQMGPYPTSSSGMSEAQGAPNMGYPIPSAPIPHPHSLPYAAYPMLVPGAVTQAPGFGYMPSARPPYVIPGPGGSRFAPSPPSGMGFAIPVPMMPGQGSQRTPPYPQFYNGQYLPAQPPVPMQTGVPPPPFTHPQHGMPVAAPVVMSPRSSMGGGGGRRGGPKGRGRHGHHHFGHHNGGSAEHQQQSYQNHGHSHASSGSHTSKGAQWIPVVHSDRQDKGTNTAASSTAKESNSSRRGGSATQTSQSGSNNAEASTADAPISASPGTSK